MRLGLSCIPKFAGCLVHKNNTDAMRTTKKHAVDRKPMALVYCSKPKVEKQSNRAAPSWVPYLFMNTKQVLGLLRDVLID